MALIYTLTNIYIIPSCYTTRHDPSASPNGVVSKMFIDATKKRASGAYPLNQLKN